MATIIPRVRLFAAGVGAYAPNATLAPIAAAARDAEALYDTLSDVLQDSFDHRHSLCATDLTASRYRELLKWILTDVELNDVVVLYYSGHATVVDQMFRLVFLDHALTADGVVTVAELSDIIGRTRTGTVCIVLDCCFAGAAGSLARSANAFFPSRVSLLAATKPIERAQYDDGGSYFTNVLLAELRKLAASGDAITLGSLFETVNRADLIAQGQTPTVFLQDGKADILLKPSTTGTQKERRGFAADFCSALRHAGATERETMWYALSSFPEHVSADVLQEYAASDDLEALWLVRRACGTALGRMGTLEQSRRGLARQLMQSNNWMRAAVGVIGSRSDLRDATTCEQVIRLATSSVPMDCKWLAFLYLADEFGSGIFDIVDIGKTGLLETDWGVCEVWERAIAADGIDTAERGALTDTLFGSISKDRQHALALHIELSGAEEPKHGSGTRPVSQLGNAVIASLYGATQRGIGNALGMAKWLQSRLYGAWRGHIQTDLLKILEQERINDIRDAISGLSAVPSVALRMAVYAALPPAYEHAKDLQSSLEWGLEDSHPWVRRVALEWWLQRSVVTKTTPDGTSLSRALTLPNTATTPGVLDLYFVGMQAAAYWRVQDETIGDVWSKLASHLPPADVRALRNALSSEYIPVGERSA